MRSLRPDFGEKQKPINDYYDLFEDWDLIEASFAQQYGIRLRHEERMPWTEFATLLAGLSPKTPLGGIIAIRSETDQERLKHFTPEQKKIRRDWNSRYSQQLIENDPGYAKIMVKELQAAFKAAFS